MPYTNVNGTSANNILLFVGTSAFYNQTLINPYSGYTVTVTGTKNINNGIYDGLGGTDTLSMTTLGDVLTLVDSSGTIMVKNIEIINAGFDGDVVIMANAVFTYGNITIRGSDGDDVLWSNNGNDLVQGGAGRDIIDGGGGNDLMFGGTGDDYVSGGLGTDTLAGGEGNDTLVYTVDGTWSGGNTLATLGSSLSFAAMINLDGMNRSFDTFNGDADDDLQVPTIGTDTLLMTSGDDVLVLSDALSPTNNLLSPRVSYMEVIDAGDGNDIVDLSGGAHQDVTIRGGNGADILAGSSGNDTIYGDAGNDKISGGGGNDTLYGGTGNDTYYYNLGQGSDTIIENTGTDSIVFGPGITFANLTLSASGLDLIVGIGAQTITIQNHFAADAAGRVETFVFNDNSTFDAGSWYPNENPNAVNDTFSGDEDALITGNVLANDTDHVGETLSVTPASITTANGGTVTLNANGTFSYLGAANYNGTDTFSYTVNDNRGGSSIANVTLNVAAVNDTPVAIDDSFGGNRFSNVTGNVLADNGLGADSDIDADVLSVQSGTIATVHGGSVVMNADGSFTYTSAPGFYGTDSFEYTLLDGNGGSAAATAMLDIAFVNVAPDAQDDAFSGDEDTVITGNVLANDTDEIGETLTVTPATITTLHGGTVTLNADGTFSYLAALNYHGMDNFYYTVSDNNGGVSIAAVALTIAYVNDAPVAAYDEFSGLRNESITGNLLNDNGSGVDSDIDGDTLSVQAQTIASAHGGTVVVASDGSFTYTAKAGFYGDDTFSYTLLDGQGGNDTATVSLHVNLDASTAIIGTSSAETITGTTGADQIFGLDGDDILYGDDGVLTGSTLDKIFADNIVIPELQERVNIADLRPPGTPALGIADGNLSVSYDATATLTFRKGFAGYDNSLGTFAIAADGTLKSASIEWGNTKTAGIDVAHQIDLPTGATGGDFGFFIIANGNNENQGYAGLNIGGEGNIRFIYDYGKATQRDAKITDAGSKVSIVYNDGVTVKVLKGHTYFTTDRGEAAPINSDGKVHVVSGLRDLNNLQLDVKASDLSGQPATYTKNDITLTALTGTLISTADNRVGIKTTNANGGDMIGGSETLRVGFTDSEKVVVSLSNLSANKGIDFKVYLNGDMDHPVAYEYKTAGGQEDILLDSSMFGGALISAIDISSVSNSALGTDKFWLTDIRAFVPGGLDTDQIRIGFEDLYNTGDADFEDVLFDININPVHIGDIGGGNDLLDGGAGNDALYGEGGNDILVIGLGGDHAYGGEGADTFAVTLIDNLVDTIHDFSAAQGDAINIADVLEGYDPLSDNIADFIKLVQVGSDTQIQINADGQGADFAVAALVLGGTGADLATMVANGSLVVDHTALA